MSQNPYPILGIGGVTVNRPGSKVCPASPTAKWPAL